MVKAADWRIRYDTPGKDGCSPRQHLEKAWQQSGRKPALLDDEPEFYPAVQHIWEWFLKLNATRGGGFGPAPITNQEIAAWAGLRRIEPTIWELDQIINIDRVWLKIQGEKTKKPPPKKRD